LQSGQGPSPAQAPVSAKHATQAAAESSRTACRQRQPAVFFDAPGFTMPLQLI